MDIINIQDNWFPRLDPVIAAGVIRIFPTKKRALEVAKKYGWGGRVIKIARRFESGWIVGQISFQPETTPTGDVCDVLNVPLLRYEKNTNGVEYQPVARFRKLRLRR